MNTSLRSRIKVGRIVCLLLLTHGICRSQQIEPLSLTSLGLKILRNDVLIGTATGFVLEKNGKYYLVTNRHVVLGCAQDRDATDVGGWICANKLSILHNRKDHPGEWFWVTEELLDDKGQKRWFEHPTLAGRADLVALPLTHTAGVQFYPLDVSLRNLDLVVGPSDTVSIVGFPFGQTQSAGLPIWKTGTVASDLDVNWSNRPMFLIDTTSRAGMSGSPVYAVRTGAYRASNATLKVNTAGSAVKFLGVYSEQNVEAELGAVWKAEGVQQLYDSLP